MKFGVTHRSGWIDFATFDFQPLSYRFNNGVPNQLTQRAQPSLYKATIDHDIGVFAQDRWTSRQLTLYYGIRYDHFRQQLSRNAHRACRAGAQPELHLPEAGEPQVERHHAEAWRGLRPVRHREDGAQGERQQVPAECGRRAGRRQHEHLQRRRSCQRPRAQHHADVERHEPQLRGRLRPDAHDGERRVRRDGQRELRQGASLAGRTTRS